MTDDGFDLSRRNVLGALGTIGAAGALGGAGTVAYFNDKEKSSDNTFTAGELDLKIDWEEHYNGELVEEQDLTSNPGPIFDLGDVKPGDHGEATISLHVFDNPAFVHMAGALTSNAENGVNEPESKTEGEDDPFGKESGTDWSGELADEILVDVWYDGTENEEDGGNNVFESDELPIASGTLRDVLTQLEDGRLLRNQVVDGTDGTNGDGAACSTSDEWKIDETPAVGDATPNGEVEITGVEREDGEVVAVEWESSSDVCLVAVKGGPSTATYEYDCVQSGGLDFSPENTGNPNRTYYEISNVQFYYCEDGDGGDGDGGQCWPNSTTQYVGFSWELPKEVGNEVQGDSVTFDLKFHAQQCRHKEMPKDPYDPGTLVLKESESPGLDDNEENRSQDRPYVDWMIDGNQITFDFHNPTNAVQVFDYRVDGESGTSDQWTGETISEGPLQGQDFGLRYNGVVLGAGETKTVTVSASEKVEVISRRGAEQKWYIPWIRFEVQE